MRWIPSSAVLICAAALLTAGCGGSNQAATTTTSPTAPMNYGSTMAKTPAKTPAPMKTASASTHEAAGTKTATLSITGMT